MKNLKKHFKNLITLSLILVLSISICACGKKNTSSNKKDVLATIKENKKITLATSPDYPPFEFLISENGQSKIVGFDIELAKEIAKKIGVELEIKQMDFDALIPALKSGQVDMVITGMSPNEERKKSVDFSDIYFEGKNAVLVEEKNAKNFTDEESLKDKKIGVQKGSTQEVYVKDVLKKTDYKSLISIPDLVMDMKNNNIDAIILNDKVAKLNEGKYPNIKAVSLKLSNEGDEEKMAVAVKKGDNKEFLEQINSVIKELNENKKFDKMIEKATEMISKEVK